MSCLFVLDYMDDTTDCSHFAARTIERDETVTVHAKRTSTSTSRQV